MPLRAVWSGGARRAFAGSLPTRADAPRAPRFGVLPPVAARDVGTLYRALQQFTGALLLESTVVSRGRGVDVRRLRLPAAPQRT